MRAAIACGHLLNKAKKVNARKYLAWLKQNCPDISEDTAERWRNLANSAHVRNLLEAGSLTKAYKACGILPDDEPRPGGSAEVNSVEIFSKNLCRRLTLVTELLEDFGIEPLIDQDKEKVMQKIDSIMSKLQQLVEKANDTEYWVRLQKDNPTLNGWHHGTYWIHGTPSPLLALKIREGKPLCVGD